jgi:hypothetical protein
VVVNKEPFLFLERLMHMRRPLLIVAVALIAASCAPEGSFEREAPGDRATSSGTVLSEGEPSTSGGSVSEEDPGGVIHLDRPPAVEVRGGDTVLSLKATLRRW